MIIQNDFVDADEDSDSMVSVISSKHGDAATEEVQLAPLTFAEFDTCVGKLQHYCIQQNYPSGVTNFIERSQCEATKHHYSLPKCNPTLHHFLKKKT
jgi:hypothetical protein